MVVVEVLTRQGPGVYAPVATVTASGGGVEVTGEGRELVDLQMSVMSASGDGPVTVDQDPEEWARSLPGALRGPYLSARVVRDDG
jgi:hypothetical protein